MLSHPRNFPSTPLLYDDGQGRPSVNRAVDVVHARGRKRSDLRSVSVSPKLREGQPHHGRPCVLGRALPGRTCRPSAQRTRVARSSSFVKPSVMGCAASCALLSALKAMASEGEHGVCGVPITDEQRTARGSDWYWGAPVPGNTVPTYPDRSASRSDAVLVQLPCVWFLVRFGAIPPTLLPE